MPAYERIPDQEFRQSIHVDDELEINIEGRRSSTPRLVIYSVLNILTLGISFLIFKWFPKLAVSRLID